LIYQDDNLPHGPVEGCFASSGGAWDGIGGDSLALLADEALELMAYRCTGGLDGGASTLELGLALDPGLAASVVLTGRRDHGHAHGSRRSELIGYLGRKPWRDPWSSWAAG